MALSFKPDAIVSFKSSSAPAASVHPTPGTVKTKWSNDDDVVTDHLKRIRQGPRGPAFYFQQRRSESLVPHQGPQLIRTLRIYVNPEYTKDQLAQAAKAIPV